MDYKRYAFGLLAVVGIIISLYMVRYGAQKPPVAQIVSPPPVPPFEHYIAGQGMIESAFKNRALGVNFTNIVTDIYTFVGDFVCEGQPLFKTDTRQFEAQRERAVRELEYAQIEYQNKKKEFSFYERLTDKSATSEKSYTDAFYALNLAKKKVETARAAVAVIATDIERSIVRAPLSGEVLQVNIRVGQSANSNPFDQKPLILFGDTRVLHVRIEIDEEDAWRYTKGARAVAFVRGNAEIQMPLTYVYSEPYIVPKKSLSGSDIERIDTRVLEVIYAFDRNAYPVYVGQLVDVYLEAQPRKMSDE